jgi:hypothetical protein
MRFRLHRGGQRHHGMDDQKRKLELVVKTAEAIWGGVLA